MLCYAEALASIGAVADQALLLASSPSAECKLALNVFWKEETVCDRYYEGLAGSVKNELAGHTLPTKLKEFISLVVTMSQRFTEWQTEPWMETHTWMCSSTSLPYWA